MIKDFVEGLTGSVFKAWGHKGLIGILIVAMLALILVGHWSGWWDGAERSKISMLQQLHTMSLAGIEKDSILAPIYYDIVASIAFSTENVATVDTPVGDVSTTTLYKFVGGGSIWLLIGTIILFSSQYKGWKAKTQGVALSAFFLCVFGLISVLIPDFANPWINYLWLPILCFVILLVAGLRQYNKANSPS